MLRLTELFQADARRQTAGVPEEQAIIFHGEIRRKGMKYDNLTCLMLADVHVLSALGVNGDRIG